MADYRNINAQRGVAAGRSAAEIDEGLRAYMLRIYNYMALAVGLTGVTALLTANYAMSNPSFAQLLYASPLKWVIMLSPLAFVLVLSFGINKLKTSTAQMIFWAFAAVMGVSLSSIFLVYTGGSIAQTFFVTSASFASLSLYGYTTKRSLSAMGSFLMMGVIGIVIAGIVNLFLQSGALMFAIFVIGVLVFAALTAYDTQRIKDEYYTVAGDQEAMAHASIFGALSLYLDFVNIFQFLLVLFGDRE